MLNDLRHTILGNLEYQNNVTLGWRHPFEKKALVIPVKKFTKADVRVFWSCTILLDFFVLLQIFFCWIVFKNCRILAFYKNMLLQLSIE